MKLLGSPDTIIETGVTLENRMIQLREYQQHSQPKKEEEEEENCFCFYLVFYG